MVYTRRLKLLCEAKYHEKDSIVTSHFLGPVNFFEPMDNLRKISQLLVYFDSLSSTFSAGFIATHSWFSPSY